MIVAGASSDPDQLFSKTKRWGLGWEESRFSHYNICTEVALLPSITVIAFSLPGLFKYPDAIP